MARLSLDVFRSRFTFDPSTGTVYYLPRPCSDFSSSRDAKHWNSLHAWKQCGRLKDGYLVIRINKADYLLHRIAWGLYYGEWPKHGIDHINGDRSDNRISNLRQASHAENGRNRGISTANSSGYTGVSWSQRDRKWKVTLGYNGTTHWLGCFKSLDDAISARRAGEVRFGFNPTGVPRLSYERERGIASQSRLGEAK